jgi:hypothetical protein
MSASLNRLHSKAVELDGKIEAAQMRHEASRQALAQAHLTDGDIPRAQADETAARVDLDALRQAHAALLEQLPAAEQAALDEQLKVRTNKIRRLSEKNRAKVGKAEDFLKMAMIELAAASTAMAEIEALSVLPDIGQAPPEWKALQQSLANSKSPLAIAAAVIIAGADRDFAEKLGSALCNHKTSAMQANGRSMVEMAIHPIDMVAAA